MSDPVTNVEIEDVLSSIRRLVSEDSRPKFDRQALVKNDNSDGEPQVSKIGNAPEKLMLTPALRIADTHDEPAPQPDVSDTETVDVTDHEVVEFTATNDDEMHSEQDEQPAQTFESGSDSFQFVDEREMADQEDQVEDTDEQSFDQAPQPAEDFHDADDQATENPAAEEDETLSSDDHESHPEEHSFDQRDETRPEDTADSATEAAYDQPSLETRIAEVENAVADQDEQWEPDGEGGGDNAAEPVEALQWEDHLDEADTSAQTTEDGPEVDAANHVANEAVEEDNQTTAEEYAEDRDDLALDADDHDFSDQEMPTPESQEANVDLFGADEAVLDEDALREMVSEIVRQELQGALGERITRNVRKLVRREIHRALASQDLD